MSRTTIRSWPSLATALLFILGACYVLFRELLHGAELTPSHVLTALALLAAIAAGHSWLAALRAGRLLLGLGLALVAIAALGYIVISSAARNAETGAAKAASIAAANAQRPAVEKKRAEALFLLDPCPAGFPASATGLKCGLRQARDAECATGKGGRCDGRAYSVTTYEAAIQGYDRQLAALGPAAEPHAGYRQAAALWVRLRGGDVRVIEDSRPAPPPTHQPAPACARRRRHPTDHRRARATLTGARRNPRPRSDTPRRRAARRRGIGRHLVLCVGWCQLGAPQLAHATGTPRGPLCGRPRVRSRPLLPDRRPPPCPRQGQGLLCRGRRRALARLARSCVSQSALRS